MVLLSSCDNLTNWTSSAGTISNDVNDKLEGSASLVFVGDPALWQGSATLSFPVAVDLSLDDVLKFWQQVNELFDWVSRVTVRDSVGGWKRWDLKSFIPSVDTWFQTQIPLLSSGNSSSVTPLDLSQVQSINFEYRYIAAANKLMKLDEVKAEPTGSVITYALSITTDPITNVPFTVDGQPKSTPFNELLAEGNITVEMPSIVDTGIDRYRFTGWLDGDISPLRVIPLFIDTSLQASYEVLTLPPTQISSLFTDGRHIKNKLTNNPVQLRGVNKTGYLDEPTGWWTGFATADINNWLSDVRTNLDQMQSWQINTVRIVITAQWWADDIVIFNGITFSYRERLKEAIREANLRGIQVILATWNISPVGPQVGDPLSHPFFPDDLSFVTYIVSIAEFFSDSPNVIIELWNEPLTPQVRWFNVAQQVIDAVRTRTDHIILVHWGFSGDIGWIGQFPLVGLNIVYSGHIYRFHGTFDNNTQSPTDIPYIKAALQRRGYDQFRDTVPILIGETGANVWYTGQGLTDELLAYENLLTVLNEWQLGYQQWEWFPGGRRWSTFDTYLNYTPNASGQILINAIQGNGPPPVTQHILSVDSQPSGTPFDIDGLGRITPNSEFFDEGQHILTMPSNVQLGSDIYNFFQWEDLSTNPVRTINLTGAVGLVAFYQLQTVTALDVHAFFKGQEVVADGLIVETDQTFQTPATINVQPGTFTVQQTFQGVVKTSIVNVASGTTMRVDSDFTPPIPPIPPISPIAIIIPGLLLLREMGKR